MGPRDSYGGAIIALTGIIGRGEHSDLLLTALAPSLTLFAVGLLLGLVRLEVLVINLNSKEHEVLCMNEQMRLIGDMGDNIDKRIDSPVRDDLATWVKKEMARARALGLISAFESFEEEQTKSELITRVTGAIGEILNWLSIAMCGLGFIVVVGGHQWGLMQLEPAKADHDRRGECPPSPPSEKLRATGIEHRSRPAP